MHERFIARQPIFDHRLKVFGYELLFRSGPGNVFVPHPEASSNVIVESTMLFDLQTLTGHAKAFINADEAALLRGAPRLLPADRVIIEILESVQPSAEVVAACKELSNSGYIFALDDFVDHPKWERLLPFATFLKVDFRASDSDTRLRLKEKYHRRGLELLAEKVETQSEVDEAQRHGFAYFQGYFFCKPSMLESREIPPNKLDYVKLLNAIGGREIDYDSVEAIFKQEPSLTYKLLRFINSPLLGLRSEVHSIRQALSLIGEIEFRRWVSIVAVVAIASGKPPELVRTALTRAYFCEEISQPIGMAPRGSELFFMGLFSVADALLDRPIQRVLADLPLPADVREALSGGANRFRDIYEALLAYERADWPALSNAVTRIGPIEQRIPECYLAAASRASSIVV